jgi:hypothetical protein
MYLEGAPRIVSAFPLGLSLDERVAVCEPLLLHVPYVDVSGVNVESIAVSTIRVYRPKCVKIRTI